MRETPDAAYEALFEANPLPMWVLDAETRRVLAVNAAALSRFGWRREEFLALTARDLRPADDAAPPERAVAPDRSESGVQRHRLKDGTEVDLDVTSYVVEFAGRPARLVLAREASEGRRAGETVRWLQRAVEQTDGVVFTTDPDGVITYVNPAFEALYGFTSEQAIGRTPRILKSGEMSAAHYQSLWHTLQAGRNYRGTHVNRKRDGELVIVEASVTPLRGAADENLGYVAIHHDVTDRRRLEESRERLEAQLAHAQRFEALGTLAAGLAHDFNNILGVMLGHAALLAQGPDDAERVGRAAEALRLAGERGTGLVRRILAFASRSDSRFEVVDAWSTVAEVERLLRDIVPRAIAIEVLGDPGQSFVWADRGQLQQVLLNLCLNARDAMPAGGTLSLRVARVGGGEVRTRCPEAAAPEYVEISVTDDGRGMTDETRRRAFEPFFTTRPSGHGSGLGLSVVYGILRAHGASVDVESALGRGTVFRLYLPLCLAPAQAAQTGAAARRGHGTVLLVEDEVLLAEVGRAWLEDAGYDVTLAADGDAAIELFREAGARPDIVVCDMGLPRRGGREVFFALREIDPGVPVILVSGFVQPSERAELAKAGVAAFLEKPYREEELLEVVTLVRGRTRPEPAS